MNKKEQKAFDATIKTIKEKSGSVKEITCIDKELLEDLKLEQQEQM